MFQNSMSWVTRSKTHLGCSIDNQDAKQVLEPLYAGKLAMPLLRELVTALDAIKLFEIMAKLQHFIEQGKQHFIIIINHHFGQCVAAIVRKQRVFCVKQWSIPSKRNACRESSW